ncbi:hypothetical protein RHSIM_Rhsim13G0018000 [Rhododendron simsii]|uniref:Uncharacterized protein n=1 Tax=Rhododendron simsii TaxID=118357 RepID=A0A834G4G6_RHOSS|nr:hypothetical protein RHSIM_Rhsim13G0018000 [Rhododendron simsii]
MKMEGKKAADVFSWLPFECTGDSEDIFELNVASEDAKTDVEDDDDAHSCCCDFMAFDDLGDAHGEFYQVDDDADDDDDYYYDDDDEEEEEEVSSWGKGRQHKKPRLSVDSISTTMVLMNDEMEKSRLFWEACLAS